MCLGPEDCPSAPRRAISWINIPLCGYSSSPSETGWAVAADGPVGAEAAAEPSLKVQVQEHLPLPGLQEQFWICKLSLAGTELCAVKAIPNVSCWKRQSLGDLEEGCV